MKNKTFIVTLIAFLAGFGIAWLIFGKENGSQVIVSENGLSGDLELNEEQLASAMAGISADGKSNVKANDQKGGYSVQVAEMNLGKNVWVVVRDDYNGEPRSILGAKRFSAGSYKDAVVNVFAPTIAGETYYVMLHNDSGDEDFEWRTSDAPVTDNEGRYTIDEFVITE